MTREEEEGEAVTNHAAIEQYRAMAPWKLEILQRVERAI